MPAISELRADFRKLHESGCFVIPNPWDVGSVRYLQSLGFKALATTSAGFAWSQARPDNGVTRDMVLEHLRTIVGAADVPVNADFESGFGNDPEDVGESVGLCVATGVSGLSIEDSTGDRENPLYPLEVAVARMSAARKAIDAAGGDVLLVGRAENFFAGVPDLDDAIRRLKAYSEAGADVLYAPGIRTREQIEAVVQAVAPKPLNVLVGGGGEMTVADYAAMGVRRISIGGALAMAAWTGVANAAIQLAEGSFGGFPAGRPPANLNAIFREDTARREA